MLIEKVAFRGRWREYFEEFLNVKDEGAAVVTALGRGGIAGTRVHFKFFSARQINSDYHLTLSPLKYPERPPHLYSDLASVLESHCLCF